MANNDCYTEKKLNVYEYFYYHKFEKFKSHIYFIIEDHWILWMLFGKNNIISKYSKTYSVSTKQTNHIIIYNKN